ACGLLSVALFLVSPLVVQSAVIVDIDGTLLLLAMATWTLCYLRCERSASLGQLAALGALFALALWTKTTSPLALVGAVIVYQILAGRPRAAIEHVAVILGGGPPLCPGSWGPVAPMTRLPCEMRCQRTV